MIVLKIIVVYVYIKQNLHTAITTTHALQESRNICNWLKKL